MMERPALAMVHPDMAPNVAAALRLAACLDLRLHLIEPFGFVWDERRVRRVVMDYLDLATPIRHRSLTAFLAQRTADARRLVLLSTRGSIAYTEFEFANRDLIAFGSESRGAPDALFDQADVCLTIPMAHGARSLNVVTAMAMVAGEAIRQCERKGRGGG
ncbi:MAG: TrmH family RNA methyltransferase [Geminicoccaceae bacterium]